MSTPLADIGKPAVSSYQKGRKLYLVPFYAGPNREEMTVADEGSEEAAETLRTLDEFDNLLARYWVGADQHITRLEESLGKAQRLYHEHLDAAGEEGAQLLEKFNPLGAKLLNRRANAGASLEATEDRDTLIEIGDWLTCATAGLRSEKATAMVYQAYAEANAKRYEYIAARIDHTLQEDETGILVIRDDHRVQFPSDLQVFYVAPPALNELCKWIEALSGRTSAP